MSEKSGQKKQYIVDTARGVFVEKGYKNVTMKDIVDACGISRGGLYLYFSNTQELFLEVLCADGAEPWENGEVEELFGENAFASDILALFLKEQKKELLRRKNNLTMAVYEYFFAHKVPKKDNPLKKKFDMAVRIVEKLIEAGVENGEFYCEDAKGAAEYHVCAGRLKDCLADKGNHGGNGRPGNPLHYAGSDYRNRGIGR